MKKKTPLFKDMQPGVKPVQGIGGLLAKALRQIMFQRSGSNYNAVLKRIDDYVAEAKKDSAVQSFKSYMNRSNLRRELWQPTMTWKNFFKGLHVMRAASIEIHLFVKFDDPPLNERGEIDQAKLELMERPVIIKANLKGEEFLSDMEQDEGRQTQTNWSVATPPRQVAGDGDDQLVSDIPTTDHR